MYSTTATECPKLIGVFWIFLCGPDLFTNMQLQVTDVITSLNVEVVSISLKQALFPPRSPMTN